MTTSPTLTVPMAYGQTASTMATLTTDWSRNQPHGLAWALGCLAQHRDGEVWPLLVAQVGPDIQRLALGLTGDFALAEDAVQETLLLVRDHAGRFAVRSDNGDEDARRWILGVAANASRQIVRRHGRQLQRDRHAGRMAAQVAPPIVDPSQRAENVDQNVLLRRELAELPDVYGHVLTLHYFGGQEYAELASHLQVSVNTVRSRVHRGLKALRERLDRCGVTLSIAALTSLLSHLSAASTVGGAATVSATTLGLISSTAVPTTSFSTGSGGMTVATVLASAFAALLALVVLSGAWLSSFRAESTPPPIAAAGGAAEIVNKTQIAHFILVVKTDQVVKKNAPVEDDKKATAMQSEIMARLRGSGQSEKISRLSCLFPVIDFEKMTERQSRIADEGKFLFTSGPEQFRLPLHPFAHYDFTIDWGDGTTEIVRSDAPAGKAIVDEAWLAQVKKGLDQSVTFEAIETFEPFRVDQSYWKQTSHLTLKYLGSENNETKIERALGSLLKKAGIDRCANIIVGPKVLEKAGLQRAEELVRKQTFGAMKLSEVFEQLTKLTGLTYVLHDRALLITEGKELPRLVCPQHTYAQAGTYKIKITENVIGGFPQIYFNGGYDCVKVMDLAQWGGNTWTNLDAAFRGCVRMTMSASDAATAATGSVKSFSQAWSDCWSVTSFPLLNTAAGINFSSAWSDCSGLSNFPLLNTAAGKDFASAWSGCTALTSFPLLNTVAGKNFSLAWCGCTGLTSFPLLNTVAGTDFTGAWFECSGLTSFPLLNTSGTNFYGAWYGCRGLTSFPLLNTATGTNFSSAWFGCRGLVSFPLLSTSAGTNFGNAWSDCIGLTSFPLLNTSAGTNFGYAWNGCSGLTSFPLLDTSAGITFANSWSDCGGLTSFPLLDTSAGTDFSGAWAVCSGLTSFPLLNTSAGTNFGGHWSGAWSHCRGLTSFPLLDTSAGTNFSFAWYDCSGLTSFPLLNTSAGTNFKCAWRDCRGLTSFPLLNTAVGTNFDSVWNGCRGLTSFPLLNTSGGTSFGSAWFECSGLTSFPLLNTSAGTYFSCAWYDCRSLTSFPLLNTSAGTDFSGTWYDCRSLTSFPLLNTSAGTDFTSAWFGCRGLKNFPLLNFEKMKQAERCFSGVTLTAASYDELLNNIAALNKVSNVKFDGGASKAQGLIGIQAREKLTQKMGWKIVDGDSPKPVPNNARPVELQPQPEEANSF